MFGNNENQTSELEALNEQLERKEHQLTRLIESMTALQHDNNKKAEEIKYLKMDLQNREGMSALAEIETEEYQQRIKNAVSMAERVKRKNQKLEAKITELEKLVNG